MRSFDFYLDPPESVRRIFRITLGAERGSELYKLGWRQIFQFAKQVCDLYSKELRDISPETIVDSWAADCMWLGCDGNTITTDDRLTGFVSTTRDLSEQWEADLQRQMLVVRDFEYLDRKLNEHPVAPLSVRKDTLSKLRDAKRELTIIKRLRPSSASHDSLETFGSDASFDYEEHEWSEQYARQRDSRDEFRQEYELDPDDARYLGTRPKSDDLETRFKSDFRDRKRGSVGTLGGIYENTLAEPPYSKNPYRRRKVNGSWRTLPPKGWECMHGFGNEDRRYIEN